jgi:hypothetical protein
MNALAPGPFLDPPLFAVCGQNVRRMRKKIYGPGDLATKETQTEEAYFYLDEKAVKRLKNAWRKLS